MLAALECCAGCPVRLECLREACAGFLLPTDGKKGEIFGCWGGTTLEDRRRVRHLPLDEQVEVLEATLEERLERRRQAVPLRWKRERLKGAE